MVHPAEQPVGQSAPDILISQNLSWDCLKTETTYLPCMATSTAENYLKQVLLLAEASEGLVTMGALAQALAVVPGTATTMVKSLADDGLLEHTPRQGVRLTAAGRRLALGVLRRHRLVETFLVHVLKMDWAKVHAEAELLEHAISDEVLDRLDALLGHPATDPHGDPIPSRGGDLPSPVYATLATCAGTGRLRIVRVTDQSEDFLRFVEESGLQPGAHVRLTSRHLAAGLVTVRRAHGRSASLSLAAAARILVDTVP